MFTKVTNSWPSILSKIPTSATQNYPASYPLTLMSGLLKPIRLMWECFVFWKPLTKKRAFMKKLKSLDLGPIAYQLMYSNEGGGWTYAQTTRAIAHYLMFLCLIFLYPNRPLVPTDEIDRVWHYHILDTQKYTSDCQLLFGHVVHHFPYFGLRNEADWQDWNAAFAQTQALFAAHFGATTLGEANSHQDVDIELVQDRSQQSEDGASCQTPRACKLGNGSQQKRPSTNVNVAKILENLTTASV